MVVGVLEVELDGVVVDVLHRERHAGQLLAELEILQRRHRAGRVLKQHLVDGERDLFAGNEPPTGEMLTEQLGREIVRHCSRPFEHSRALVLRTARSQSTLSCSAVAAATRTYR